MSDAVPQDVTRRGILYRRVVAPILALLTQGITPEKIALSLAVGLVLGVFPVLGSTTLLCTLVALVFRLNLPAVQLFNYLVYPLQLLLVVPFIRAGERLFRAVPLALSLQQMLAMSHADLPHAISVLWLAGVHAMSAWILIGPPVMFLVYLMLARTLRRVANAYGLKPLPTEAA